MKKLILLTAIFLSQFYAYGQSLDIFNVNRDNYPLVLADFFLSDENYDLIRNVSLSDFEVYENGIGCKITSVYCPPPDPIDQISSVLTIDISGSMSGRNIDLAKAGVRLWIDKFPAETSECAITAFDHDNYFLRDFTNDRAKLKSALNKIQTVGGTDFNAAFLDYWAGALPAAEKGVYKKIIVMLTDGASVGNETEIIDYAKRIDATIYCIVLHSSAPEILKNISEATGGMWFDKVRSEEEIKKVYNLILKTSTNYSVCQIEWESPVLCDSNRSVYIEYLPNMLSDELSYKETKSIAYLEVDPSGIEFLEVEPGTTVTKYVTVKAHNHELVVNDIKCKKDLFSIVPTSFTLAPGESKTLAVTFAPEDSSWVYGKFDFDVSDCPLALYVSGGFRYVMPEVPNIKLLHPNGAEQFLAGSDTIITWTGVLPSDTVTLKFSPDNGKNWDKITTEACNLTEEWKKLPLIESDSCLIMINQEERDQAKRKPECTILGSRLGDCYELSPDGRMIAVSTPNGANVYASDGKLIKILIFETSLASSFAWNLNSTSLACGCQDGSIIFFKVYDWSQTMRLEGHKAAVTVLNWVSGGATLSSTGPDGSIKYWNTNTGTLIRSLNNIEKSATALWKTDNTAIAIKINTKYVRIIDPQDGHVIENMFGLPFDMHALTWKGNNLIAAECQGDNSIKIINVKTGSEIQSTGSLNSAVRSLAWDDDASQLAVICDNGTFYIWNMQSKSFEGPYSINSVYLKLGALVWSGDGDMLALKLNENELLIFDVSNGKEAGQIFFNSQLECVTWRPDGLHVAAGDNKAKVSFWDENYDFINWAGFGYKSIKHLGYYDYGNLLFAVQTGFGILFFDCVANHYNYLGYDNTNVFKNLREAVAQSPDKSKIAYAADKKIMIYNLQTQQIEQTFPNTQWTIDCVEWSSDGNYIISGGGKSEAIFWNASDGSIAHQINNNYIGFHRFSDDRVAAYRYENIYIYSFSTGELLKEYDLKFLIRNIAISPNNKIIALSSGEDNDVHIYNLETEWIDYTLSGHKNPITDLQWDPLGRKLATSSSDGTVRIWSNFDAVLQSDVSDSVFTISIPRAEPQDVDMGEVMLENQKDSTVQNYITNIGAWPVRVDSIYIRGADANAFELAKGKPVYSIEAGQAHFAEFIFKPTRLGVHNAEVVVLTQSEELVGTITGTGVEEVLEIANNVIDFGRVQVDDIKDTLQARQIVNVGSTPITLVEIKQGGPDTENFSIISTQLPASIPAGETCLLDLRFAPLEVGRFSGSILFHYDGPGSPARVRLAGEGYDVRPMIAATAPGIPDLVCTNINSTTFSVANPGSEELIISEIIVQGNNPECFEITDNLPLNIDPESQEILHINYKSDIIGSQDAELLIRSNAEPDSEFILTVNGTKDSVSIVPTQTTVDLGYVCQGQIKGFVVNVENIGSIDCGAFITAPSNIELDNSEIYLASGSSTTISGEINGFDDLGTATINVSITDSLCGRVQNIMLTAEVIEHDLEIIGNDLGILCPGEVKDTVLTFKNNGILPLDCWFNSSDIQYPGGNVIRDLLPGETYELPIKFNTRDRTGNFSISITVNDHICGEIEQINLTGRIVEPVIVADDQTMTCVLGGSCNYRFNITNATDVDAVITGISGINPPFSDNNQYPIDIPGGEDISFEINYSPSSKTITSQNIVIEAMPCNVSVPLNLTGNVTEATATIELANIEGYPGDKIKLPIIIRDEHGLISSGINELDLRITYDNSLLAPKGYPVTNEGNDISSILLTDVPLSEAPGTLLNIDMAVGLGKRSSCPLTLELAGPPPLNAVINLSGSQFTLRGVCPEGGDRLINPNSLIELKLLSPNPATTSINVEYSLTEKGTSTLLITNMLGKEIKRMELPGKQGINTMQISLKGLAPGSYFLQLQTPTQSIVKPIIIGH